MEVSQVMSELRQDHRNLKVLLDLLDREIKRIEAEETPDFELLHDIMLYMTGYPDAVHHKKEDWVYAKMAAARPEMHGDLKRIERDHADISKFGNQLLNDFDILDAGEFMRRDALIGDARSYLTRQRDHMQWEDSFMFPLIASMESELDLGQVSGEIGSMTDPVFGQDVESTFHNLFEAIRNEAGVGS